MASVDPNVDVVNWMSQIPEKLWDTPLAEIAIPGSHESFSSGLDPASEIGPDEPPAIQLLGPLAKGVVYNWSKTQSLTFKQQLSAGIRYFDLRVASRAGSPDIYFVHGLYGSKVKDGVKEIVEFLDSNKKEVVILDFNHFYLMNDEQHRGFLNMLDEICGNKLCLFVGMKELTLNMLWENGLQIVVVYHHQIADEIIQVWPGSACIVSHWANTMSVPQLFSCLDHAINKEQDHFKVCQCVLTPDFNHIFRHLNGSLLNDIAMKVMPDVMKWLKQQKRGKCGINIVIADYIEIDEFAKAVINMNFL